MLRHDVCTLLRCAVPPCAMLWHCCGMCQHLHSMCQHMLWHTSRFQACQLAAKPHGRCSLQPTVCPCLCPAHCRLSPTAGPVLGPRCARCRKACTLWMLPSWPIWHGSTCWAFRPAFAAGATPSSRRCAAATAAGASGQYRSTGARDSALAHIERLIAAAATASAGAPQPAAASCGLHRCTQRLIQLAPLLRQRGCLPEVAASVVACSGQVRGVAGERGLPFLLTRTIKLSLPVAT